MWTATTLAAQFDRVTDYWSPKVVARINGQYMKVAKLKGAFTWHAHAHEDELFYVVRGRLRIQLEDGEVALNEGDFFTVPRGVRHNPIADEECWVMLIEPMETKHTGDEVTPLTRSIDEQLR